MSYMKYSNWYKNYRFKTKLYSFENEGDVIGEYKNFQLLLLKRHEIVDDLEYCKLQIITPNGRKEEPFLESAYMDSVVIDSEFAGRVNKIIKEDKKKGIIYDNDEKNKILTYKEIKALSNKPNVRKNAIQYWKNQVIIFLENVMETGDYDYKISLNNIESIAEKLYGSQDIYAVIDDVISGLLDKYEV